MKASYPVKPPGCPCILCLPQFSEMKQLQANGSLDQSASLTFPLSGIQPQPIDDEVFFRHLQDYLPGHCVLERRAIRADRDLTVVVNDELSTPVLDEIQDYLHLIAPRQHTRIDPLHKYQIKKMRVVITEDPGLHLIWYYDTIFIKPIVPLFLSFTMWAEFLLPPSSSDTTSTSDQDDPRTSIPPPIRRYSTASLSYQCRSALGFVRTYAFLVQHRSDFDIAQSLGLIPQDIDYSSFRAFIKPFQYLPAGAVSPRYEFGQMRLTRLNWAVRLLQPRSVATGGWFANRLYYLELYTQSADYSRSWLPPLLFAFAVLSLMLSAMQVMLAGLGTSTGEPIVRFGWGFSIATIVFCSLASGILLLYFPIMLLCQMLYIQSSRQR
ncbi:hypothetical protein HDV57DRAFT_479231 [Trichoderma longibrachiatum]